MAKISLSKKSNILDKVLEEVKLSVPEMSGNKLTIKDDFAYGEFGKTDRKLFIRYLFHNDKDLFKAADTHLLSHMLTKTIGLLCEYGYPIMRILNTEILFSSFIGKEKASVSLAHIKANYPSFLTITNNELCFEEELEEYLSHHIFFNNTK